MSEKLRGDDNLGRVDFFSCSFCCTVRGTLRVIPCSASFLTPVAAFSSSIRRR